MQHNRPGWPIASLIAAAIALLQPGIDPVFLTLLSASSGLAAVHHGWIVGATQGGMAAGALVIWLAGSRIPPAITPLAALVALVASIATIGAHGLAPLIALRALFGVGMGIVYTRAMSAAAVRRPTGAYGVVFLIQLILSTIVALLLPSLSRAGGAGAALAALALAPLALIALVPRITEPAIRHSVDRHGADRHPPSPAAWALAIATFCFIATTMMVWSFTGALAVATGIGQDVIGRAVAVGSVAGALTALAVMREEMWVPLPLTGLLAGLGLLSPLLLTQRGDMAFILAIILLNIGSTAIIIRCSGSATAASTDPMFRRFVACVHSLAMIAGPLIGSTLVLTLGSGSLGAGALALLASGWLALLFAASRHWRPVFPAAA